MKPFVYYLHADEVNCVYTIASVFSFVFFFIGNIKRIITFESNTHTTCKPEITIRLMSLTERSMPNLQWYRSLEIDVS